jgi:2-oxo-4-hydroxy-4-carboxy-5-ureidoimidazoline decarboxylase
MKSGIALLLAFFLVYNIMSVAGSTSSTTVKETCAGGDFNDDSHDVLMTVPELVAQPSEEIVSVLGGIYEHSQWVAEKFSKEDGTTFKTVSTVSELAKRLKSIVNESSDQQKLALLRAHPDLCEKVEAMKALTKESQEEQSRSGLQFMTEEELKEFKTMNESYKNKFGFPFILAVRNANKDTVLSALEGRLHNSSSQREFNVALEQVHNIAWMRLLTKVNIDDAAGYLTCHGKSLFDSITTSHSIIFVLDKIFSTFDAIQI